MGGRRCVLRLWLSRIGVRDRRRPALEAALVEAAGPMRILGPNCYGFLNFLDGAALWPDQHGATRVESGVAIVTQSSNLALNLTMQARGVPLAYVVTVGNQAQSGMPEIAEGLLEDDRVTALGLHVEGVGDLPRFAAMAARAQALGKPVVVLKSGASEGARAAAVSHTGSLAGNDAGANALFERLGMARVRTPAEMLEALKLLHVVGPLPSGRIGVLSSSGGEAGIISDMLEGRALSCPPLTESSERACARPWVRRSRWRIRSTITPTSGATGRRWRRSSPPCSRRTSQSASRSSIFRGRIGATRRPGSSSSMPARMRRRRQAFPWPSCRA
jgi:acyl-CoA synthetase (NDP forming)